MSRYVHPPRKAPQSFPLRTLRHVPEQRNRRKIFRRVHPSRLIVDITHLLRNNLSKSEVLISNANMKGSPKDLKRLAYMSMVHSSLDNASSIWYSHQQNHKSLFEKTQIKTARWICNDFIQRSIATHIMDYFNLEPLEERRRMFRLVFLYRILHEQVAMPADELGLCRNLRTSRGLVTRDKLNEPRCSTTEIQEHLVARTILQWNRPFSLVTCADSAQIFSGRLMGEALSRMHPH